MWRSWWAAQLCSTQKPPLSVLLQHQQSRWANPDPWIIRGDRRYWAKAGLWYVSIGTRYYIMHTFLLATLDVLIEYNFLETQGSIWSGTSRRLVSLLPCPESDALSAVWKVMSPGQYINPSQVSVFSHLVAALPTNSTLTAAWLSHYHKLSSLVHSWSLSCTASNSNFILCEGCSLTLAQTGAYLVIFLRCLAVLHKKYIRGQSVKYLLCTAVTLFALVTLVSL